MEEDLDWSDCEDMLEEDHRKDDREKKKQREEQRRYKFKLMRKQK